MSWKAFILVFLGGGVGSMLRYGLSVLLGAYSEKFPFATLVTNIVSCILLGYLIGIGSKNHLSPEMKVFLMVGVCGGFSTFSTFSAESYQLLNTGNTFYGMVYMAASFLICLIAIYLGLQLGK
jgi:CrcB protein